MSIFRTMRRVEFADTDAAGIMHFARFFTLMEEAEHEFLRSLGTSVLSGDDRGPISWPRVSARCDFRSAARFEDELTIDVSILRLGESSVAYGFVFRLGERLVAEGEMTSVHCRLSADGPPRPIPIPEELRERMTNAE